MRLRDFPSGVVGACLAVVVVAMSCGGDPAGVGLSLDGVEYLAVASREHTDQDLDYPTRPPAGGDHLGTWHNCGVYTVPLLDEAAVHSLEHGAVWVTYRPDLGAEAILSLTGELVAREQLLVSPHPDQTPSGVAPAWARRPAPSGVYRPIHRRRRRPRGGGHLPDGDRPTAG